MNDKNIIDFNLCDSNLAKLKLSENIYPVLISGDMDVILMRGKGYEFNASDGNWFLVPTENMDVWEVIPFGEPSQLVPIAVEEYRDPQLRLDGTLNEKSDTIFIGIDGTSHSIVNTQNSIKGKTPDTILEEDGILTMNNNSQETKIGGRGR